MAECTADLQELMLCLDVRSQGMLCWQGFKLETLYQQLELGFLHVWIDVQQSVRDLCLCPERGRLLLVGAGVA